MSSSESIQVLPLTLVVLFIDVSDFGKVVVQARLDTTIKDSIPNYVYFLQEDVNDTKTTESEIDSNVLHRSYIPRNQVGYSAESI
jgi:hypothetical protein